jgi:hypothetical protein
MNDVTITLSNRMMSLVLSEFCRITSITRLQSLWIDIFLIVYLYVKIITNFQQCDEFFQILTVRTCGT